VIAVATRTAKKAPKTKTTRRLQPGEWRSIRIYDPTPTRASYLAVTQFCDPLRCTVTQRSATGPTKPKARRALEDKLAAEAGHGTEIESGTLLRVLADEMFAEKRAAVAAGQMSPGTVRNYESHWRLYIEPVLGDVPLEWVTPRRCDQFLKQLRRGKGYAVVKGVRSALSEILAVAERADALPRNPVEQVADIPGSAAKPARALDPAEAVDLWEKLTVLAQTLPDKAGNNRRYRQTGCDPDLPHLVLWMLGTSDRLGNALAVHWPWIDLQAATAKLGPNVIRVKGEGLRLNDGTTKTRDAVLDLPDPVVAMLLLRQQRTYAPMGPVFCDAFGGLRDPSNTSRSLRAALDEVGYDWVTSHVFRKTVATVLDDAGLSARHVADQLRHARPSMTQDRYMKRGARNPQAKSALEAMLSTKPDRKVVGLHDGAPGRD
jgi:integrase